MVKYWKNGVGISLTSGTTSADATALAVAGNDVYVAGYEKNEKGYNVAKYWINGVAKVIGSENNHSGLTGIYITNK